MPLWLPWEEAAGVGGGGRWQAGWCCNGFLRKGFGAGVSSCSALPTTIPARLGYPGEKIIFKLFSVLPHPPSWADFPTTFPGT